MKDVIRYSSVAALLVLAFGGVAWAEEEESLCGMCHDEVAAAMLGTAHGIAGRGPVRCEDCHQGNIEAHMDEGDPELITTPTGRTGEATCLSCHQAREHSELTARRAHRRASVSCSECHTIHQEAHSAERALLSRPADELCASCHAAEAKSFNRPFGHKLDRGLVSCISCHDPHAGKGERSLRRDRSGDGPCVSCHAEKRGPFVFPHVSGVSGDCMSCHQPHGSSNPMALTRSRVDQLCLECHSTLTTGTLGSQAVSSHDLRTPRFRQCTVCHVAVHGSHTSPQLLK
jgi:DmsE family decaheme c-type cytochrome